MGFACLVRRSFVMTFNGEFHFAQRKCRHERSHTLTILRPPTPLQQAFRPQLHFPRRTTLQYPIIFYPIAISSMCCRSGAANVCQGHEHPRIKLTVVTPRYARSAPSRMSTMSSHCLLPQHHLLSLLYPLEFLSQSQLTRSQLSPSSSARLPTPSQCAHTCCSILSFCPSPTSRLPSPCHSNSPPPPPPLSPPPPLPSKWLLSPQFPPPSPSSVPPRASRCPRSSSTSLSSPVPPPPPPFSSSPSQRPSSTSSSRISFTRPGHSTCLSRIPPTTACPPPTPPPSPSSSSPSPTSSPSPPKSSPASPHTASSPCTTATFEASTPSPNSSSAPFSASPPPNSPTNSRPSPPN